MDSKIYSLMYLSKLFTTFYVYDCCHYEFIAVGLVQLMYLKFCVFKYFVFINMSTYTSLSTEPAQLATTPKYTLLHDVYPP